MDNADIQQMIKTTIETQVVLALNSVPEAIEKLVKAALSKPVDENGRFDGYRGTMPYLDYLVGEEIRSAARGAVHKVIQEHVDSIEEEVRKVLSSDTVVAAVTKALVGAASEGWRIGVEVKTKQD